MKWNIKRKKKENWNKSVRSWKDSSFIKPYLDRNKNKDSAIITVVLIAKSRYFKDGVCVKVSLGSIIALSTIKPLLQSEGSLHWIEVKES